jgi:hypothetical protein
MVKNQAHLMKWNIVMINSNLFLILFPFLSAGGGDESGAHLRRCDVIYFQLTGSEIGIVMSNNVC